MSDIPPIDYSTRDFASTRSDLQRLIPTYLPEWTSRNPSDFGMVFIELVSYVADQLHYYIDRAANEAFLATAVQRASVLTLASMLDYRPSGPVAATVDLTFTVPDTYGSAVTIPAGTKVSTVAGIGADPVVFETDASLTVLTGTSGSVAATEGVTMTEDATRPVGVSTGNPDQTFALYNTKIIDGSLTVYVDEDGAGAATAIAWRYVGHLIDAEADERTYTTFTDEFGVTTLFFGDNTNGRIPSQGAVITAVYRVGGGARGNVGANTLTQPVSALLGVSQITNPSTASGGSDAESTDDIRRNAPRSLSAVTKGVTETDYEILALRVPGVALAKAAASVFSNVALSIAPLGGGAPTTSLKNDVQNYLADKKMIGTSITVVDPTYVPVNITLAPLNVLPQYSRTLVRQAAENALADLFDFNSVTFGQRVTLSSVYRALANVEGLDYVVVTVLSTTGSGLADIELDPDQIPSLGTVTSTLTGGLIGS